MSKIIGIHFDKTVTCNFCGNLVPQYPNVWQQLLLWFGRSFKWKCSCGKSELELDMNYIGHAIKVRKLYNYKNNSL